MQLRFARMIAKGLIQKTKKAQLAYVTVDLVQWSNYF